MNPMDESDQWLLGDQAKQVLVDAAASPLASHQLTARLRKQLSPEQVHRLLELVELRRRGARKFSSAERMYFTRTLLEQSTDQWIARYKATRFADGKKVADLCCGIGGDAFALAEVCDELLCCDRSPTAIAYCERNMDALLEQPTGEIRFECGDATAIDVAALDAWHIDPDRRPAGKRSVRAERHEPPDEAIDRLLERNANAAIKLAPGGEPPTRWVEAGELEWISRGGECKQLVVWLGELAADPGVRRATVLKAGGEHANVVRTMVGSPVEFVPQGHAVDRYLYEPDPAVLAADLAGTLAERHGWWMFASTTGYLTGKEQVDEPACAAFEVLDVLPLKRKVVASYLRERKIGRLEIKHRSIDLSPDELRKQLKLAGDGSATLLATRVLEKRIAIIARRLPPTQS